MKSAILNSNSRQIDHWLNLFSTVSPEDRDTTMTPSFWRPTDLVIHLWAWQTVSTARVFATVEGRAPDYPAWFHGDDEEVDSTNLRIYESYRHWHWSEALSEWESNYLRLIELGKKIPELDFLDGGVYSWLDGYSIADIFLATYHHHLEHQDPFLAWLNQRTVDGFMWI